MVDRDIVTRIARRIVRSATPRIGVATAIVLVMAACASAPKPQARAVELADVEDVLVGPVSAASLRASLPASFLVGSGRDLTPLLAERAGLAAASAGAPFTTIVDGSELDSLAATAVRDHLVEAALENGGTICFDKSGACARSLRGGSLERMLVRLGSDGSLIAVARFPGATAEQEASALGR